MDNADEVKLTHKEVALFLGDDLINQNQKKLEQYNLQEEYAKTARNRQKKVWLLLALCFLVVGAGTIVTTKVVSTQNQKISVKIDTFNDLNLRSLLDMVNRSQNTHEDALNKKEELKLKFQEELDNAKFKHDNDLFTVQSVESVSTKSSIELRKKIIETEYEESVKTINKKYESLLKTADEEIQAAESQISAYDTTMLEQARKAESSIDSQKQLHKMELKAQSQKYEQKLKDLRIQLIDQQLQAAEERKKAVEEVQKTYQNEIINLRNHITTQNDAMEQLAYYSSCDGFILESKNPKKISLYITKDSRKYFESEKQLTALLPDSREEIIIVKTQDGFYGKQKETEEENAIQYVPKTGERLTIVLPKSGEKPQGAEVKNQ